MKRQVLCFSVHRKLLCWTNIFQPHSAVSKAVKMAKKPRAYSFWTLLTRAVVDARAQPTVWAPHSVCAPFAEHSWEEDIQLLKPEGKGDCTPSWDQGTSTGEWHSVDLVHSGHLHFSWSVCWIYPAQNNVHTSSGKVVEAGVTALLPICRKWGWLVKSWEWLLQSPEHQAYSSVQGSVPKQ